MPSVNGDNRWALSIVQGDDPGEIQAKSQVGTQQNAKRRSVVQGRNGEVKWQNKDIGKRDWKKTVLSNSRCGLNSKRNVS
jgi:hypothetical protein